MNITNELQIKSFLGVPIFLKNGELYGNLCCFDKVTYSFKKEDVQLLQTMATFLSYVIELEHNKNKAEHSFEKLYKENQLVLDSLTEGVFGIDRDGKLSFCNLSAQRMFEYTSQELVGKNPLTMFMAGNRDNTIFMTLKDGKTRKKHDDIFCNRSGIHFPIQYTCSALMEDEQIIGVVVAFSDITEQKKSEELMLKSEKLNLAGQLAAGISHEIRNPLTAIKGFFQLIKVSDQKEEYFTIIESELNRIEEISGELIMLAKPQSETHIEQNLYDIIEEVVLLLKTQAVMKSIEITTEFEDSYLGIVCDKTKLKQVFINLIKNAIEVMDDGLIRISVHCSNGKASISVRDNGPGIPKDRLHRIGEPFYSTKEKGTGLGLLTSYKIIENHQGSISVKSKVGSGTTFLIDLPIIKEKPSFL